MNEGWYRLSQRHQSTLIETPVKLTFQKVVQASITGNFKLRSDSQSRSSLFRNDDGTDNSFVVTLFQALKALDK